MSKNFGDSDLGTGLGCAAMILAVFIGLSLPLIITTCAKVNRPNVVTIKHNDSQASIGEQ